MAGLIRRPLADLRLSPLALLLTWTALGPFTVRAQDIADNSFLIEEAYNQEAGVVQHISTFSRPDGGGAWDYAFTQEWPLHGLKHQISYSLPVQDVHSELASAAGIGDVALNYRYQAIGGDSPVAFAPRFSVLVPTGQWRRELGNGGIGPVTRALEGAFDDVLRGRDARYAHWRTPVEVAAPALA